MLPQTTPEKGKTEPPYQKLQAVDITIIFFRTCWVCWCWAIGSGAQFPEQESYPMGGKTVPVYAGPPAMQRICSISAPPIGWRWRFVLCMGWKLSDKPWPCLTRYSIWCTGKMARCNSNAGAEWLVPLRYWEGKGVVASPYGGGGFALIGYLGFLAYGCQTPEVRNRNGALGCDGIMFHGIAPALCWHIGIMLLFVAPPQFSVDPCLACTRTFIAGALKSNTPPSLDCGLYYLH